MIAEQIDGFKRKETHTLADTHRQGEKKEAINVENKKTENTNKKIVGIIMKAKKYYGY